jgi:hypothetical protein
MEQKETRVYKKHKEGFKIAVDYKVNTSLKPYIGDDSEIEMYPLYIEVRMKGQKSYFKSSYPFFVSSLDLPVLLADPFLSALLSQESSNIRLHLESYMNDINKKPTLNAWSKEYRANTSNLQLGDIVLFFDYLTDFFSPSQDEAFRESIRNLIRGEMSAETALMVATVLKGYGLLEADKYMMVFIAFNRANKFLKNYKSQWYKGQINTILCFDEFFIFQKEWYLNINNNKILSFPKDDVDAFFNDLDLLYKTLVLKNIH